jgi:hypothetical protein
LQRYRPLAGESVIQSIVDEIRQFSSQEQYDGTVEAAGKYLVTGAPVTTTTAAVLKLSFENTTPGTNLELCAGTGADFIAGTCPTRLSDSGGPGFVFLTIVDTPAISGKIIYVIRAVGAASATFRLTIE